MGRRNFDPEYKLRVARMVVDEGQGVPQVSRDTGVGETAIRRWVEQLKADRSGEAGDGRPLTPEQRRIRELEEENRRLREDKALLKKGLGLLRPGTEVMHRCISALAEKASVQRVCDLLEVNRSSYYAARQRRRRSRPRCVLGQWVKEAFEQSEWTYGSHRVQAALRSDGIAVGRYRVRRLMREQGLRPVWKRAFVVTTQRDETAPVVANHLDRQFQPACPNEAWVTDITYIRTHTGWTYLAAVLDLFHRKVVGWSMARRMDAELACSALRMALQSRQPEPGLLVHSDQGCQYTSDAWRRLLAQHGCPSQHEPAG